MRYGQLVISDHVPGLIAAVELVFSHLRQRSVIHRARNILAKVAIEHQGEAKKAYGALFDDTGTEPGEEAIAVVRRRAQRIAATRSGSRPPSTASRPTSPA